MSKLLAGLALAGLCVAVAWLVGCSGDVITNNWNTNTNNLGDLPCCPNETQQGAAPSSVSCVPIEPHRSSCRLTWEGGSSPWRVTAVNQSGAVEQFFNASNGMELDLDAGTYTITVNGTTCGVTLDS